MGTDGEPPPVAESPSRGRALVETILIVAAAMSVLWAVASMPRWKAWENSAFGGQWLTQILAFMVVPLALVFALGGRPGRLGVTFAEPLLALEAGMTALAVVGPANGIAFPLLGVLGWSPLEWPGGLVLAAVYALCLPLTGLVLRRVRPTTSHSLPWWQIGIAVAVLVAGLAIAAFTVSSKPLISRLLLALLVVGPGEELLFRGIVQSRLDQAFGHPWRLFGARLGWGWVLASLLFGLAHLCSPSAPGLGAWALWTAFSGLLFGYVRAKSGSFFASAIVHGVLLAIAALFGGIPSPN